MWSDVIDRYDWRARYAPIAVIASPLTFSVLVLFGSLQVLPAASAFLGLVGVHLVLMQIVRDRGTDLQPRLWQRWGGQPTVQRLRWSMSTSRFTHEELRQRVTKTTGIKLPSRNQEQRDPARADQIYTDAIARLREARRNHAAHPRVFSELINYGFARNLFACKPIGVGIAAITACASATLTYLTVISDLDLDLLRTGISTVAGLAMLALWFITIRESWVRRAAERYADALLASA